MRWWLGILTCTFATLMLSACTMYGEHPVREFGNATGGLGLEQALWRDIKDQDWTDLDRHIASNFVYATRTGRLERAAAIDEIEKMQILEYSLGNLESEMNGDTFVVTYTITLHGRVAGQGLPNQPERRMTVWQHQKSGWVAIAHSVLGVASE